MNAQKLGLIEMVESGVVRFSITDSAIEKMRQEFLPLKIDGVSDKSGYLAVKEARMKVKTARVEIEKTRKALKEESIRYGRMVDGEAKRITGLLEPIENDLEAKEKAIDAEKERIREERQLAEKKKLADRLQALVELGLTASQIDMQALGCLSDDGFAIELERARNLYIERQQKAAEEARIKAEEEAQAAKLKAEQEDALAKQRIAQEAEAQRLAAIDKEQREREARIKANQDAEAAKLKAEQDKFAADKAAFEEQRRKDEEEKRRAAEIDQAKKDAAEKARAEAEESARKEAEDRAREEVEAKAEEERIAALKPDAEKLIEFAAKIQTFAANLPDVHQSQSRMLLSKAHEGLISVANYLHTGANELSKPKQTRRRQA